VVLLDEVPGVVLVELDDCEDCEPHCELDEVELSGEVLDGVVALEEEVLDCGMLLALESGVEVLPVTPVLLLEVELPAMLPVCALDEVSGVLDCELMSLEELLLGEAVLAVFGLVLSGVEVELFGAEVELFGVELSGVEVLGEVVVLELLGLEEVPAFPEMLPAVFWSELEGVAIAAPPLEDAVLETVRSLSLTFLTPETDFASFLASFLSLLLATVPLRVAVPSLTEICTPCSAGLFANC